MNAIADPDFAPIETRIRGLVLKVNLAPTNSRGDCAIAADCPRIGVARRRQG